MEAAIDEATTRFGMEPSNWSDGDPHDCPPWRHENISLVNKNIDKLLPDIWEFFSWASPQLPKLIDTLHLELSQRHDTREKGIERNANDADERYANREWCDELAGTLRRWCGLLEIDPENLPGYRKALRRDVWHDLIPIDGISEKILSLLDTPERQDDLIFRPRCLEQAHKSVMEWLTSHPKDVDRLHHRTFEAIVAEMIQDAGWSVELTKQTRDGGYDIMCLRNDIHGFPVTMLVETKLYGFDHAVGLPMVDRLMGVRDRKDADLAVLITNTRITKDAWVAWEDRVGRDLAFIDREELLEWLRMGRLQVEQHSL